MRVALYASPRRRGMYQEEPRWEVYMSDLEVVHCVPITFQSADSKDVGAVVRARVHLTDGE